MGKRNIAILLVTLSVLAALSACGTSAVDAAATTVYEQVANSVAAAETTTTETADTDAEAAAEAPVENAEIHTSDADYVWDEADVVDIALDGASITADGDGVTVDEGTATITAAGTYRLSGTLDDGQIAVDTDDEGIVRLILDGVDLSSSTGAPIHIDKADAAMIVLADGTQNAVSDAASYVFEDPDEDEPNAAVFSKADLTIYGEGALVVTGNYNDGIASKDGLVITSGTITVDAVDDGIRGKDYLVVEGGTITVTAGGDGLKSDNEDDATKGYIAIEAGVITVTSGGDAVQAETDVIVTGGELALTSGGGSGGVIAEDESAKGIKGAVSVTIDGGTITVDSADDAVHSNGAITINGGALTLASGDDGVHADATLDITGGDILITTSYEGIESAVITVDAGTLDITASDDGLNVAGGNDGSGMNPGPGRGGGMGPGGGAPGQDGEAPQGGEFPQGDMPQGGEMGEMPQGGGMAPDGFAASGDYHLTINGGTIVIDADGDGIDSNGTVEMTGGLVVVSGPTNNGNGALDYMGSFAISGGTLVAAGSSGMAQAPGGESTQYSALINFDTALSAGTPVHVETSDGESVLTFVPAKDYQSLAFSSPSLASGVTYDVYTGGSASGTEIGGLVEDGTYTPGEVYTSFTISEITTRIGASGRGGGW